MKGRLIRAGLLLAAVSLAGCMGSQTKPEDMGFKGNYDGYQGRRFSDGALSRLYPGAELSKYDKVAFFTPRQFHSNRDQAARLDAAQLQAISDRLHLKLEAAFGDLLAPPGPGVLVVVPTLVGGERVANPKDALDYIPFRIVINAGKRAYREVAAQELVQYSLQLELDGFDGESGQQVLGMIDRKQGEEQVVPKGKTRAGDLDPILDAWAQRMRRNWDQMRAGKLVVAD